MPTLAKSIIVASNDINEETLLSLNQQVGLKKCRSININLKTIFDNGSLG